MTDEELKDLAKLECKKLLESEKGYNGLSFQEFWAEGVKYGLAEGRKELEQWKQEWQDAQIKANEEGFARTTLQIKYSELEKENAELLNEKVKEMGIISQRNLRIEELEAQIEKMKCCGNCINRGLEKYIAYPCSECRRWHRELDSDRWELAE